MNTLVLLSGLRFIDSFFPSGGYAFSAGLEAAVQRGAVTEEADLARYVEDALRFGLGMREAVAVARGQEAGAADRAVQAIEGDWELESLKAGREARAASRQMGRQMIRAAVASPRPSDIVQRYATAVEEQTSPGHLAVATGVVLGSVGWRREEAVAAFLYQSVVGFVAAALKLLPLGQRGGQRIVEACIPWIAEMSERAVAEQTMTGWTPIHDIDGMRHAHLTHRLFRS